jgi:enoyl-CoA hydratase
MTKKKLGMPFFRYEERIPVDDFEEIIYEKDPPIGRLILNTPEKRNPLSYARIIELSMGLQEMEMDDDIRVIIIKGAGSCFCSGYDLTPGKARDNNPNPNDPRQAYGSPDVGDPPGGVYTDPAKDGPWFAKYAFFSRELYFRIFDLQKPVICQIHGYCLAGATHLAGFSDMRIVAEDAQIGFPVARNLTIQGFQYEIWLMGATRAKYYLFTGDPMSGRQAYDWGWASAVFPANKLEEETENLARRIALTDPVLLMMQKRTINRQMELMGFKTGMAWSQDVHAAGMRRGGTEEGTEFWRISGESGLRAAVDWRDGHFGISYPAPGKVRN